MQLYSRPLSPYSAFVRGVLYLKDLSFKPMNMPNISKIIFRKYPCCPERRASAHLFASLPA